MYGALQWVIMLYVFIGIVRARITLAYWVYKSEEEKVMQLIVVSILRIQFLS